MMKRLREFISGKNPSKKMRYIIVLGLIGLLLIIVSNALSSPAKEGNQENLMKQAEQTDSKTVFSKQDTKTADVSELEASYEKDLTVMLNKIQGVSNAEVMVNLDSTNVKVYEKDLVLGKQTTDESDKSGGNREIQDNTKETHAVLVRQGDKDVPLLIQTKKPTVRGVFVVAKGVDHAAVKKWVVEAISHVLDVPSHKVSVMPKK